MQKSLLFLLLFAFQAHLVFAFQANNLNTIVSSTLSDADKVKKINQLSTQLIENNQLNDAEVSIQKALEIANKVSFEAGKAMALDNMGLVAQSRFDYTNAMNYFVEALRLKDSAGDKLNVAKSKLHIGKVFFLQRNEENALVNYQAALTLLNNTPNNLPLLAEAHRNLGDVYLAQKLYGKATGEFDMALKIWANDLQDFKKAATIANYLGNTVADMGDNDGALTYFDASLNYHRNLNDINGVANDHLNLAKIYTTLNDSELAAENVDNALSAFQQINNSFGIASAYNISGKIALKANNRSQAEEMFEKSADILRGMSVLPGVPEVYKSISEGFSEIGNFPKAFSYAPF
jgi:tetratricopeptide (TPR) repeat protein